MTTSFQPPPTYAEVIIQDEHTGKGSFNPIWLNWFLYLANFVSVNGGATGSTIQHNSLGGLQGGKSGEMYHLTAADFSNLTGPGTGTGAIVRQDGPTITGLGSIAAKDLTSSNAAALIHSATSLSSGAGSSTGTLTNAPSAGNPTKWVPIDDNGTTRYVPAW